MRDEWDKLQANEVIDLSKVREWVSVSSEAKRSGSVVHHGSLATIVVEKNHELPEGDKNRKFKGRTVFLGDQVRDHNGDAAIFEELQSAPAAMEAGRICDMYGCIQGNCLSTADGVQAYVQAKLQGPPTWVEIPRLHWPVTWFHRDGSPKYRRPVVPLVKALYGHPNAGCFWEAECKERLLSLGFRSVEL